MQQITARITADATVKTFESGRSVVNFNVAYNQFYRSRDGERKQLTQIYQCSYWATAKIAPFLTKGRLIEMFGTISARAYEDSNGKPQAALQLNVFRLNFHDAAGRAERQQQTLSNEDNDSLPF